MTIDLRIGSLRSRYFTPEDTVEPEALRRRLDDTVGRELRGALDRRLVALVSGLGLGPEAEIAIDRVAVRLRVRGDDVSADALAEAWAQAIVDAVRTAAAPLAAKGGGEGDGVAIFPDRFAAEDAFVRERCWGGSEVWWWRAILGGGGGVPSVREVVAGWIRRSPAAAPGAVAAVARAIPDGLGRVLSDRDASVLAAELRASHRARLRELREAAHLLSMPRAAPVAGELPRPGGEPPSRRPDGGEGSAARAHRGAPPALERDLLSLEAIERLLLPEELRVLSSSLTPEVRRFLALCLLLTRRPSALLTSETRLVEPPSTGEPPSGRSARDDEEQVCARDEDLARSPPVAAARPRGAEEAQGGSSEHRRSSTDGTVARSVDMESPDDGSSDVVSEEPVSRAGGERTTAERLAVGGEHRVGCGGLLFLIRRLAASPLTQDRGGVPLEDRLLALGWIALHRALDPLPEAARRAAFERERPVLAVFAGTPDLPDDLLAAPRDSAAREVAPILDALAAELPRDLEVYADGALATYGSPAPFAASYPHRALAHLLLRAGRLRATRSHADLHLPARAVSVALRVGGWDIDPGWVPYLGRVIRFHYDER